MIHHSWVPKEQGRHKEKVIHERTLYPIDLLLVESLLFLPDLYGMVVNLVGWHRVESQFGVPFHVLVVDRVAPRQGKHPQNLAWDGTTYFLFSLSSLFLLATSDASISFEDNGTNTTFFSLCINECLFGRPKCVASTSNCKWTTQEQVACLHGNNVTINFIMIITNRKCQSDQGGHLHYTKVIPPLHVVRMRVAMCL
jgi:hypothetical protein